MNTRQLLALRLIAVFLVLLGLSLAVGSWYVSKRKTAIFNTGQETTAAVVNAEHDRASKNRNSYYISLRYATGGNNVITQTVPVPDDVYTQAVEARELRIRFDPADAREIVFVDFPYDVVGRYIAGVILVAAGLLLAYFVFRPVRDEDGKG